MMRRATVLTLLWCALAGLVLTAAGGQTAQDPPQNPEQRQTFRARIDSVSVDVIVLDKKGQPVTDLTPADFEVREANKIQAIDTFKYIDVDASQSSRPTTHREIVSIEDQRREAGRDDTRVLVLYLDDYHVRRGNSMRIREQLATFVSQLAPTDLVAIMYPLTPVTALTFSRNHDGTAQAIMGFEGRKYDYTPRNAYEERYQMQPPEILEKMRNDLTISSLEAICSYLGSLRDGRKTVLFVSEGLSGTLPAGVNTTGSASRPRPIGSGLPQQSSALDDRMAFFNSTEILSQLRLVFAAANRANTSVYTIDPRGLAGNEFDIADNVSFETDRRTLNESMDTLRTIAGETDGRAIVNRNNPMPELRQMVTDNSSYYLIGYTSTEAPRDGKFHEIQVRVNRKDVDVRARKGYWAYTAEEAERALAPPKPELARDVMEAFETLAATTEPNRRRKMTVWMGALPGPAGSAEVVFAWEGNAGPGAEPFDVVDHLDIAVVTEQGDVVFRGTVPKTDPLGRQAGRVTFAAPAGAIRVRVTAQNGRDTRVEADDVGFVVPDFARSALLVTSPVVFKARTARQLENIKADPASVPAVGRSFSRTERLLLQFGAYGGAAAPTVTMRLLNLQGDAIASLPAPTAVSPGRYESQLGLASLPPGDYLIEMAAASGADTTRTLLAIRVTG